MSFVDISRHYLTFSTFFKHSKVCTIFWHFSSFLRLNNFGLLLNYYFNVNFRYFPSNLEVIDWLGSYFIEMQVSEKAIGYFERAALMQPDDVKWQLMIASCYRRSGNYHKALETYKTIHRRFPENIECLKFLVKISSDMGLKEAMDYAQELKKAERAKDMREQRASSSRPGSRKSSSRASNLSRNGSAVSSLYFSKRSTLH